MSGNADVIEEFRANGGRVGGWLARAPLVLLTTAGRRTGRPHTTPAVSLRDGERYHVFASNAGSSQHPSWYRNILANPQVTMEVPGPDGEVVHLSAHAVPLEGAERDRYWELQCTIDPAFREYEKATDRVIPVVALTPLELGAPARRRAVAEQLLRHHADLRAQLSRVRDGLAGTGDLGEQLRTHCLTFCYGLQLHHTREDGAFTAVQAQFPELAPTLDRLRAEHRAVEKGLAELEALLQPDGAHDTPEVRAEVERVVAGLEEHFAYEEEQLVPAMRR